MIVAVRPHFSVERTDVPHPWSRSSKVRRSREHCSFPQRMWNKSLCSGKELGTPAEPGPIPMVPFPSGGVLRMAKPQDWKSVLKKQHPGSIREVRHDGQTYFRPPMQLWGAFAPDDRTLVFAREPCSES